MSVGSVIQGAGAAMNAAGNAANSALNSVADLVGGKIPAFITCISDITNFGLVPIDFSRSASISNRASMTSTSPNPPGGTGAIVKKVQPPIIKLNNVIFEGLT